MNAIEQLSEALAASVQLAGESVVRVEGRRRLPSSGIVWSDDGLVVTARHTLDRRVDLRVGLGDDSTPARVLGTDPGTDLAVLRLDRPLGRKPSPAKIEDVRPGHLAIAVARPGDGPQATMGIVSAVEGAWRSPLGGHLDHFVQSDVVMYPGFSGGALIDAWGRLIGMNSSGLARGVSLAVPAASLTRLVPILAEHGRLRRGYLGVGVQPARLPRLEGRAPQTVGLLVASVESGSPAERGGILLGDVLLSVDGRALATMDDLLAALSADVVGKTVALEVLRGGRVSALHVEVGERAAPSEDEDE